jgi:hypothetical protein
MAIACIIFSSFYNNEKEEKRTPLVLKQLEQRVMYAIYYVDYYGGMSCEL